MANPRANGRTDSGAGSDRGPGHHVRYFYVIRVVTSLGGLAVALAYLLQRETLHGYHYAVFALGLLYPHVSYYLQARMELGRRIEHATLVVDAFIGGSIVYFVGYSLLPSIAITMITLINPVAFTGFGMLPFGAIGMAVGLAIPTALYGTHFEPQDIVYMNIAAAVFLLVYFTLFAHAVYLRTNALQRSRRELRQQRITIEIEKKRSDSLLHSILPASAVAEFESHGSVQPRRHEDACLLYVAIADLARLATDGPPEASLASVSEVLKSIEAICVRHRLEGLGCAGHGFLAAAGLGPAGDANAAVAVTRAAIELRQSLSEEATARRARGQQPLGFSIALHCGSLLGGVIGSHKSTFGLFGHALDETLALSRHAKPDAMIASAALAARAENAATFVPAGQVNGGAHDIPVCHVADGA